MQKRSFFTLTAALVVLLLGMGPGSAIAADADVVSQLVSSLGVTKDQATGGAGAIFDYAKSKLDPGDFAKVADAVPDMDTLLKAAPSMGGLGSLGGLSSLAGSFTKLGISPDMVTQFVPQILSSVESSGGSEVMNILAGVLK